MTTDLRDKIVDCSLSLENVIAARKIRPHCTQWSHEELLDLVIALYNKYILPEFNRRLSEAEQHEENRR